MLNSLDSKFDDCIKSINAFGNYSNAIRGICWNPLEDQLAVYTQGGEIDIWDPFNSKILHRFNLDIDIYHAAWSADGTMLAACDQEGKISIFSKELKLVDQLSCNRPIFTFSWAPLSNRIVFVDRVIKIWDVTRSTTTELDSASINDTENILSELIVRVIWSKSEKFLVLATFPNNIVILDLKQMEISQLYKLENTNILGCFIDWSPDGKLLVITFENGLITIFNMQKRRFIVNLEGHTDAVTCASFSYEGNLLASKAMDGTIRIWNCKTWETVTSLKEAISKNCPPGARFHPTKPILVTLESGNRTIRLWDVNIQEVKLKRAQERTIHYINAKTVLVGDSGVGKSALGIRLVENEFRLTDSTHGAQFWQISVPKSYIENCGLPEAHAEMTIWDLAGQPDYHLIHQLFLDDTNLALLLFDGSRVDSPFGGIKYWAKVLNKHLLSETQKFLIAARCDVSPVNASAQDINNIINKYNFSWYGRTCSKSGEGLEDLKHEIFSRVPWNKLPLTSTPYLFQVIRDYLLKCKEDGETLLAFPNLVQEINPRFKERQANKAEIDKVVELLQSKGLVYRLDPTPTISYVLLKPELINQYASCILLAARNCMHGTGTISEREVICANIPLTGIRRIEAEKEKTVLESTIELFIKHDICFREMGMLVFPSQFNLTKTEVESKHPRTEVKYEFSGPIELIYASLVVRLSNSLHYCLEELWKNGAEFACKDAKVGFTLRQIEEGTGELELYFYPGVTDFDRVTFIQFIKSHLRFKGISVNEKIPLYCPSCNNEVKNWEAIEDRIKQGKLDIPCQYCDDVKIIIPLSIEELYRNNEALHEKQKELLQNIEQRTNYQLSSFRAEKNIHSITDTNDLILLHISDLHFGSQSDVITMELQLKTDLKNTLNIRRLDYLVISGDITCRSSQIEYEAATEFFSRLVREFGLDSSRIIIVPGNHDLDWEHSQRSYYPVWGNTSKALDNLAQNQCIRMKDVTFVREEGLYKDRFKNFNQYFYKKIYNGRLYPTDYSDQAIIHECPKDKILFLALNSSWEIDHFYKLRAGINMQSLSNALGKIDHKYDGWLKIAVMHHSITGTNAMNDDFMELLSVHGFQLLLHGHIHEAKNAYFRYDSKSGVEVVGAGTFGAENSDRIPGIPLQFNLLQYNTQKREIVVNTRKREKTNGAWMADARWGDKNSPVPFYQILLK